ncbi:MAG: cysteine synthase A [Candidatus Enterosoma sp.]|nr:cysteine synthase A [Bacilli bacterium]MDD6847122.1 cysteine synthase A [bacterium]MDY2571904.1 cysteine synthase A [Candidatus Enterosoma sp.]MDD7081502.1 cysteine synthase A [bacterium]MDD7093427.1 cysteine synthase A [bacterium]
MNYKHGFVDLVGSTPLVRLERMEKEFHLKCRLFAKYERNNPTGSIKDRIAKEILLNALERKEINQDTVIVEPTSGNTGIGLCAVAASLGLKAVIFMPSSMSVERRKMMTAFGAEIVLTDAKAGMPGAIAAAKEFASKTPNSYIPGQFDNLDNSLAHYKTTGPEIYRDLDGNVDVFLAGFGTGGTITGTSRYLKEQKKDILTIGIEPEESPVISKGVKGPHKIQGIGAGFKPAVLDLTYVDKVVTVPSEKAYEFARLLARKEGLFCGISSGANVYEAVEIAKTMEDKNIVTVLPDNGERYLSVEGLF